jgi:hypothetical protein
MYYLFFNDKIKLISCYVLQRPLLFTMNHLIINEIIQSQVCYETISKLSDESLMPLYLETESVKHKIELEYAFLNTFIALLSEHPPEAAKTIIMNDRILQLIPAGTKGVMRGNQFNKIVKDKILSFGLDHERFDIQFEKQCPLNKTSEIPDWYIVEKETGRAIIGMNQLDLWSGGQQTNRGSKYIIKSEHNTQTSKLVCVVCNYTQIKSTKSKEYKLFEIGFQNNTICYLNNLQNIIADYYSDKTELNLAINSCLEIDLGPTVLLNSNETDVNA